MNKNADDSKKDENVCKIASSDLDTVINLLCLQRQEAIDLLMENEGDLKKTLDNYISNKDMYMYIR